MGKPYSLELDNYPNTLEWANRQDVSALGHLLHSWAGEHATIVGSGGSYSAAYAVAKLREIAHRSATAHETPLQYAATVCRLNTRTILLSAEGKNADVLSAAKFAQQQDAHCAALTLTKSNPLIDLWQALGSFSIFSFEMTWGKDGYLATNSLIATALLFYKALFGEEATKLLLENELSTHNLELSRRNWNHLHLPKFPKKKPILLLYDALTQSFAIDFESKSAEADLGPVQIADFRQFAHGRHLQLRDPESAPLLVVVHSRWSTQLAQETLKHIPDAINRCVVEVPGETEQNVIMLSLVTAAYAIEAVAKSEISDPGKPDVPEFGRCLHRISPYELLNSRPTTNDIHLLAAARKRHFIRPEALGREQATSASKSFLALLYDAPIKAIITDFDGTLCNTEDRYIGMCPNIAKELNRLLDEGLQLVLASGRGDSLHKCLKEAFGAQHHSSILVGYYGGSIIESLDCAPPSPASNTTFESLSHWLQANAFEFACATAKGGQLSIRTHNIAASRQLTAAIRTWIADNKIEGWRVFSSGHSLDILDANTSKLNVLRYACNQYSLNGMTEVLRLGDCGHEDGNDFELLATGLSLSADRVSASLETCWNYAPPGNRQARATLVYLQQLKKHGNVHRIEPFRFT